MYSVQNEMNNMNQNQNIQQYPSYQSIPKIRVIVRKRPLNKKEIQRNEQSVVDIRDNRKVVVKEVKTKVDLTKYVEEHSFIFDMAFDEDTSNEAIYMQTVRPMIEAAFNKTKVTCFAYGQTGSGKTFTMMGTNSLENGTPGLYLLAGYDIFTLLSSRQYQGFSITASFYEIYCGKLFDLLNERKTLNAREDGKQNICIVGLTERKIANLTDMMNVIQYGLKARTVGVTGANSDSSRSHGIIQITIKDPNNNMHGKISFIDLAGSERAADVTDTNKQTRIDGAEINKSLLALKECIRALDQDKKHTPFRGSKLTLVLRDSFVGNCKTLMIANISPALGCSEHSLNTLRYADRVKELRGKPEISIGAGNQNLNFDPGMKNKQNEGKDPQEILANLLMMPRNHKNTVKYNVDANNNRLSEHKHKIKTKFCKKKTGSRNSGVVNGSLNNSNIGDNSIDSSNNGNSFNFMNIDNSNNNNNNNTFYAGMNNMPGLQNMNMSFIQQNMNLNQTGMSYNMNYNNQTLSFNNQGINPQFMNNNNCLNNNNINQNNTNNNNNNNTLFNNNNGFQNQMINNNQQQMNNPLMNSQQMNNQLMNNNQQQIQSQQPMQNQQQMNTQIINNNQQQIQTQQQQQMNNNQQLNYQLLQSKNSCENKENCSVNSNYGGIELLSSRKARPKQTPQSEKLPTVNNTFLTDNIDQTQNAFSFLNDYTSFGQQKNMVQEQQQQPEQNEESFEVLKQKYEILVNQILSDEKTMIESHKKHIDSIVEKLKMEMNMINVVEQKSNIDEYVDTTLGIYDFEIEKITAMRAKLLNFKSLLKQEAEMSTKLSQVINLNSGATQNNMMINDNTVQSNTMNIEQQNYPINLEMNNNTQMVLESCSSQYQTANKMEEDNL